MKGQEKGEREKNTHVIIKITLVTLFSLFRIETTKISVKIVIHIKVNKIVKLLWGNSNIPRK